MDLNSGSMFNTFSEDDVLKESHIVQDLFETKSRDWGNQIELPPPPSFDHRIGARVGYTIDSKWNEQAQNLITTLTHREYQKALLRLPMVPISFIAAWAMATHFIKGTVRRGVFENELTKRIEAGPSPHKIFSSALLLLAVLFWCFVGWCGFLQGSIEGAIMLFFALLPISLFNLPIGNAFRWNKTFIRAICPSSREPPSFVDVLIADALTSLSKVLADGGLVCLVLIKQSYPHIAPFQSPVLYLVVPPIIASCPYLLRIRQIWIYLRWCEAREKRTHLLNLAKYAVNFPGIWCQALLLSLPASTTLGIGSTRSFLLDLDFDRRSVEQLVLTLGFLSGILGFLWDVHMDWGLNTSFGTSPWLPRPRQDTDHLEAGHSTACLREVILFRGQGFYRVAIVLNLLARLSGALLGLSELPRLASLRGVDLSLLLQLLEVSRRSLWMVLRVEWESIKNSPEAGYSLSRRA